MSRRTHATPRRVLFLAWAPFFSGAERALLLTLRSLDSSRYVPFVLAGTEGEFANQVRASGIPCEVAPLRQLDRRHLTESVRSLASVFSAAVRHRASIIHANEAASFQPGGYVARALRIPAISHVRFPDTRRGYRWFLRSGCAAALFVSNDLRASALAEAPDVFGTRAEVLHDGVELQPVWSAAEKVRVRRKLELPEDAPLVAMAGQVAEVKGIWDFVEAVRIVADRAREPHFVVLGDDLKTGGQTRAAMEQKVATLGLTHRFTFLGFRQDAPGLVQAFDVIAVPSHVEPLGNATLEAMAAGVPVIGSRVGGIPEMIVDGETGLLVPPRDPASLARAIIRLVTSPTERSSMAAAARRRAGHAFSIEAHGRRLQHHYDQLHSLGRPRTRPRMEIR